MKSKCAILVCGTLQREVVAAIEAEQLDGVEAIAFPCDCGRPASQQDRFYEALRSATNRFDHLLLIGGPCLKSSQRQAASAAHDMIERCFDLFLPSVLIQKYQAEGAYLLTPGWLNAWMEHMRDWGFDQPTARAFFAETCTRLILLDSGVDTRSAEHMAAMAAFVDRPCEIIPVGLDLLRLVLTKRIQNWRPSISPRVNAPANMLPSDYAMVFDMLNRLARFEAEEKVAQSIFELFEMICAPALMAYLPCREGQYGALLTAPAPVPAPEEMAARLSGFRARYAYSESGDGFMFQIQQDCETLGVLLVEGIRLPQHKEHYLNLSITILPVLALAVSNARNFEQLENARDVLQVSERALTERMAELEQAMEHIQTLRGIIPICASCKNIRDDSGYWNQVEVYIRDHSDAEFSHDICPKCMEKLYPEDFE